MFRNVITHYGLLLDMKNQRLVDRVTELVVPRRVAECRNNILGIHVISGRTRLHQLLIQYLDITKPSGTPFKSKHQTKYNIKTTPGPPVTNKTRMLALGPIRRAKKDFVRMMQLQIARPAECSWASHSTWFRNPVWTNDNLVAIIEISMIGLF